MSNNNKISMNYIYFGLLFFAMAVLQIYHVLLIPSLDFWIQSFYVVYACLEAFIEVLLLAGISVWLRKHKIKGIHSFFIACIALLFLCRLADFAVVRLMDLSAWYWISSLFQETFTNFIEMLYATNVKLVYWSFVFLAALCIVVFSCFFFHFTEKVCHKKSLAFSAKKMLIAIFCSILSIISLDIFLYVGETSNHAEKYSKALLWKRTFFSSEENILVLDGFLKRPKAEEVLISQLDEDSFSTERKPDLFLFIVESLRDDFLTKEVTPSLASFREENYRFTRSLSNANGTQLSWFSFFYSMYPFYWKDYQSRQWTQGSTPLTLLKKMGYKIQVYASSRLNYYSMDWVLFGENNALVDQLYEFRSGEDLTPSQTDRMAIDQLAQDVENSKEKGGRVFITFLDSPHFGYSWPKEKKPLFLPIDEQINYWQVACNREDLERIKNRYRNALNYVDDLFDSFKKTLMKNEMWDDSVVVFAGDHGEEFNENGCMFHASGLSLPQLQIPLYIKLGRDSLKEQLDVTRRASQMDVFPTLFHYLKGKDVLGACFQGQSLFGPGKKPYVVGARYNASQPPYEFYIQNELYRLTVEFVNRQDIFHSRSLKVNSIVDKNEEKIPISTSFIQSQFGDALDQLFSLF